MKTDQIIIGAAIFLVAIAAIGMATGNANKRGTEITTETLKIGENNPPIWLFYNDSEVNSRKWADFGARSSYAINIPLLNILYQSILVLNGQNYRVEVIGGLQDVARLLGPLPKPLHNPKARVSVAEEDWIRTAILAKYGGLWLSPSVVALKPFGILPNNIVAFGEDDVPMYGSTVPGFRALWVPAPANPMMVAWEARIRGRLENQLGGREFRGDAKSDWIDLAPLHSAEVRSEELARNPKTGKKLELEDVFASGTEGRLPFEIPSSAKYLVVPYADLIDRRQFGWVLRSSEEQIMDSDLAISYILRGVISQKKE